MIEKIWTVIQRLPQDQFPVVPSGCENFRKRSCQPKVPTQGLEMVYKSPSSR